MNIDPSGYYPETDDGSLSDQVMAMNIAGILAVAVITHNAFMTNGFMRFIKALDEVAKNIYVDIFAV